MSTAFKVSALILCASSPINAGSNYKNIYGDDLRTCSVPDSNMALTGYTRSGSCVDYDDDAGSHHICIDVSSADDNFCTVTGQSDWCSSYMPCDTTGDDDDDDGGDDEGLCPVQNWCVCQWAFASYIATAGGCDFIQEIQCDAINLEAAAAYASVAGTSKDTNGKYTDALRCIEERCEFDSSQVLSLSSTSNQQRSFGRYVHDVGHSLSGILALVSCMILLGIAVGRLKKKDTQEKKLLNPETNEQYKSSEVVL